MAIEKIIDIKIQGNVDQAVGSLRSQLREAQAEVAKLSEKFGVTSVEATNAAKKAGELKDRIGDAKALTDAFNPDAKFKALSSSLSGVAGGFAAVQGGMALFGTQSEEVEKTLLKVQSAMALSMGLQAIGESIDSFNQLNAVIQSTTAYQKINSIATIAAAAVQKLFTGAVNATAVSFKALKAAIVSTGIGALVVGIGYLISKLNESSDATEELTKEQEKLNIQLEYTKKLTDDNAKAIDYNTQIALANAKKRGASEKELLKIQLDAYEAKGKANNKEIEDIQKTQNNQYNLTKEQNKRIQDLREQNQELQRQGNVAIANLDANFAEKQRGNSEKLSEQQKAQRKKDLDDLKIALQAQRDARQASIDEITQAIGDAQDKQNEFLGTAQEAEEQKVKDKYFRLLELAKQQGRTQEELYVLEFARENELNDIRLIAQNKRYEDEKNAADKLLALEESVKNAKRQALDTGLDILMQFAGKNKAMALSILAVQKGLAIADIVVGSAKSIAAATSALAAVPAVIGVVPNPMYAVQAAATAKGIALTKITAATSIASILASTISSAKQISGGGGAGSTAPSGGAVSGGGASAPQFNVVGNTGANQIAQSMASQNAQPIQAYVVSGAVTNAQSLDRNIISNASMG
jgi:hypothetical protein